MPPAHLLLVVNVLTDTERSEAMAKRVKLSKNTSDRKFVKGAMRVHEKNMIQPMRGGIRA